MLEVVERCLRAELDLLRSSIGIMDEALRLSKRSEIEGVRRFLIGLEGIQYGFERMNLFLEREILDNRTELIEVEKKYKKILVKIADLFDAAVDATKDDCIQQEQQQQIVDYYSATNTYEYSESISDEYESVFTRENDKHQWLALEQKSRYCVEARQTDQRGFIIAKDTYMIGGDIPKCVGMERVCKDANMMIPFATEEINLIYEFGQKSKAETCTNLSAILPKVEDGDTSEIVKSVLYKLNALSEETCVELVASIRRRINAERKGETK